MRFEWLQVENLFNTINTLDKYRPKIFGLILFCHSENDCLLIFNQPSLFFLKSIAIIAVWQDNNHPKMAFRGPGSLEYVFLSIRLSLPTRVYASEFDSLG